MHLLAKVLIPISLLFCPLVIGAKQVVISQEGVLINDALNSVVETGISRNKPASKITYTDSSLPDLLRSLPSTDLVISLGGNPKQIESSRSLVAPNLRLIYGAQTTDHELPGINLLFDPTRLIAALRKTAPSISNLKTVVTSDYSKEHLEFFRAQALSAGITFEYEVAEDARSLAALWQSALDNINPKTDALVLVDTSLMDRIGGLRFILKASWRDKIIVLTTVPSYTNRGVSMGVAHNLEQYGEALSKYLNSSKTETQYFASYLPALNKRNLNHSGTLLRGLKYDNEVVFVE